MFCRLKHWLLRRGGVDMVLRVRNGVHIPIRTCVAIGIDIGIGIGIGIGVGIGVGVGIGIGIGIGVRVWQ